MTDKIPLITLLALKINMKKIIQTISILALFICLAGLMYLLSKAIWGQFKLLDPKVSVALLTAATTILVATLTVVLGKYYERKKDIEAHYRQKKTEIYDEFLREFFKVFHSEDEGKKGKHKKKEDDLVAFFREWQRKIILWGSQEVLKKYIHWIDKLKQGEPDAQSMFLTEELFIEIRKDLGHKNNKLAKGTFMHLLLQNPTLFLAMAKENPKITLAQISEAEQKPQS